MPSITKKRLQELEAAEKKILLLEQRLQMAEQEARAARDYANVAESRMKHQDLAHEQLRKYNKHLLNTIVDYMSVMTTPILVVKSETLEQIEIPDCLKPRDTFPYLFERFVIGDRVSHKRTGHVGCVDKVGACTLGVIWDNEGWSSCPIEDIDLVKGKE